MTLDLNNYVVDYQFCSAYAALENMITVMGAPSIKAAIAEIEKRHEESRQTLKYQTDYLLCQCGHYCAWHRVYTEDCMTDGCNCKSFRPETTERQFIMEIHNEKK